MSVNELRGAVLLVPGIVAAEVEPREADGPLVRVWLDGSRDAHDVADDVRAILGEAGFGSAPPMIEPDEAAPAVPDRNGKRTGLGRGLEALIPPVGPEPDAESAAAVEAARLDMVAIEERAGGTVVRVRATDGGEHVVPVTPGASLNDAIAVAVAGLRGLDPAPVLRAVEVRTIADLPVMVVIAEAGGRSVSGTAIVEAGMPFTLGSALWAAFSAMR